MRRRTRALMKTRNAVIFGLAKLAESRDTDTGDHLERIRVFVMLLARQLQQHDPTITDAYIEDLGLASSLHDIGKVGIPDAILLKPGRLDPIERQVMESHAQIGAECLGAIAEHLGNDDFLATAHEIALWHHEKFDGSGYPTRISGPAIPLSARIVALADVYDALISPRVYKRPFSHDEAKQTILKDAGTHFDPVVVNSFLEVEDQFRQITGAFQQTLREASDPGETETVGRMAIPSSPTQLLDLTHGSLT